MGEVTLGDRFGQEGVEEGISVESVERRSLGTVDLNSWLDFSKVKGGCRAKY